MSSLAVSPYFERVFLAMDARVLRASALVLVAGLYAFYGSPTPDSPGWVEVVVGGLLVFVIGVSGARGAVCFRRNAPLWFGLGQVLLCYGVGFGVLNGFMHGQDLWLMIRDVLPFLFLCLPVFLWPSLKHADTPLRFAVLICVLVIGIGFSVRAGSEVLDLPFHFDVNALYYLGNSPAVLLLALFSLGAAFSVLAQRLSMRSFIVVGVCLGGAVLAVLPMVLSLQRASLGAVMIYGVLALGVVFVRYPRRVLVVLPVFVSVVILSGFQVSEIMSDLTHKTDLVGQNMRFQEWRAVWGSVDGSAVELLFGHGWGAGLSSPAVADIRVNYTHSLLSAMLLKTGLVGLVLTGAYLWGLGMVLLRHMGHKPLIVMAISAPILIDVFLYAAYKSFEFGLVLALVPALFYGYENVASGDRLVYSKLNPNTTQ